MTAGNCPVCGAKGRPIQPVTVESLAPDNVLERLRAREGFQYCPATDCAVAWFHTETSEVVDKGELKVRVGMKETSDPRPICYCFAHDAADFEADIRQRGQTDIPAEIAAKCKQGLDRCEETNPQGSCCLGNVNRVVQAAKKDAGDVPEPAQPFAMAAGPDCCAVDDQEDGHE